MYWIYRQGVISESLASEKDYLLWIVVLKIPPAFLHRQRRRLMYWIYRQGVISESLASEKDYLLWIVVLKIPPAFYMVRLLSKKKTSTPVNKKNQFYHVVFAKKLIWNIIDYEARTWQLNRDSFFI